LKLTDQQTIDPALIAYINAPDKATSDNLLHLILVEEAEPLRASPARALDRWSGFREEPALPRDASFGYTKNWAGR